MIRVVLAGLAVTGSLLIVPAAQAASPRYILVTGPDLRHPVLLGDWSENHTILLSVANSPVSKVRLGAFARKHRLRVSEFWSWWAETPPIRPTQAVQHGWFYPAHGSRPALTDLLADGVRKLRLASPDALQIFARHGIPTSVP